MFGRPRLIEDPFPSEAEFARHDPPGWAWPLYRGVRYLLRQDRLRAKLLGLIAGGVWSLVLIYAAQTL